MENYSGFPCPHAHGWVMTRLSLSFGCNLDFYFRLITLRQNQLIMHVSALTVLLADVLEMAHHITGMSTNSLFLFSH